MSDETVKIIYPFTTTFLDYPTDEDETVIVYFIGCNYDCKSCQNIFLRNHNTTTTNTIEITVDKFIRLVEIALKNHRTNKLILSGGDSLSSKNRLFTKEFLDNKPEGIDVCVYTGNLIALVMNIGLKNFKFLKTGTYEEKLKQNPQKTNTFFRLASSNQKLYNENLELISENGIYYFK